MARLISNIGPTQGVTFYTWDNGEPPVVLDSITVTPANTSVALGLTQQMVATGHYSNGSTANVTGSAVWSSSVPARATVTTSGGLVTTVAQGATVITATVGSVAGNTTFTTAAPTLVSIEVAPSSASIALGLTQAFIATATYTNGDVDVTNTATWASSSTGVATVNTSGLATSVTVGAANITAAIGAVTSPVAPLTVTAAELLSIAVTPSSPSITVGNTQQMVATGTYTDGPHVITGSVTWSSGNTACATVSVGGLVTAVSYGTAQITATLGVQGSTTASVTLRTFDFTVLTPGAVTAPTGTAYDRATVATVQTGASTVASNVAIDTPRAGKRTSGGTTGLVVEVSMTNDLLNARNTTAGTWQAGGGNTETRPAAAASPDGSTTQATATSGATYGKYCQFAATTGVNRYLSMWALSTAGTTITGQWQAGNPNVQYTATGAWVRTSAPYVTTGVIFYLTPTNNLAQAITHDMHMLQTSAYLTEFIDTAGSAITCAGDHFSITADCRAGGELRLEIEMEAKGSSSQYAANMYLYYFDANNYARVSSSTGAVTVVFGGVSYTTAGAASWAANDKLTWWVTAGANNATAVYYRIGTGSGVQLSTGSPTAFATIPSGAFDAACAGTAGQFSCRLQKVTPYVPAAQPAWV